MDFNCMNIRNYHIYIKYVNTCNNHKVITNLSNFRKHWILVSQRDTTMSSWASPTVVWRKEAWSIEILCPSSESVYIKSIIYRLSMPVQDSTLLLWNQGWLWGGGSIFMDFMCYTYSPLCTWCTSHPPNNVTKKP